MAGAETTPARFECALTDAQTSAARQKQITTGLPVFITMLSSLLFRSRSRSTAPGLRRFLRSLRFLDNLRYVFQQFLRVVNDAVFDRPLHSADAFGLPSLIVQSNRARAVQHFQIRHRV